MVKPPTPRFERYVAIGDSSTEGLNDFDGRGGFRGWSRRLAARIAAEQGGLLYANFGVRGSFDLGIITPFASFDMSQGIDRKELVASDIDCNGIALYAGAALSHPDEDKGLRGEVSYYDAFGPAYRANGMQYSHGYVGMKAKQVGGTLTNRFLGWHPAPYVGIFGVSSSPQDLARKSGTRVLHGAFGYDFSKTFGEPMPPAHRMNISAGISLDCSSPR